MFIFAFFFAAQAYDQHLNMILGEVEETVTTVELDEETFEEIYKVSFLILIFLYQLQDVISTLTTQCFCSIFRLQSEIFQCCLCEVME